MKWLKWLKWAIRITVFVVLAAVLHYTLPQRDIVRIISTEVLRVELSNWNKMFYAGQDSGNTLSVIRDLRLINTAYPDEEVMVYRNEDTGWFAWPPYFKTNSSDVSAQAEKLKSDTAEPTWVAITHYGWRFSPLSIYPNAISIHPVEGPDTILIPWFNIALLIVLGLLGLGIYRFFQRLWGRLTARFTNRPED